MPGWVIHQDPERVVIVIDPRKRFANSKTSHMLQVYILVAGQNPMEAVQTGADELVCGDCKLRGTLEDRPCYVNVVYGPSVVWRAWRRGNYPFLPRSRYPQVFCGRRTRLGAYGDPAFIPLEILRWIVFFSDRHTGYTHQWQTCDPAYRHILMASVDSPEERSLAQSMGWRTFRTRKPGEPLLNHEIACPASNEAGHKTTCLRCCLCDGGLTGGPRKDIGIYLHGSIANKLIQIGGFRELWEKSLSGT